MACYNPIDAYKGPNGVVFKSSEAYVDEKGKPLFLLKLPCGSCIGCRLDRARDWTVRCMHEASMFDTNCVVTLTYSPEKLPVDKSLNVVHFQNFIKNLRKAYCSYKYKVLKPNGEHKIKEVYPYGRRIRYFHCGEYGEYLSRPHYHCILFNFDFPDKKLWKTSGNTRLYHSEALEKIWGLGLCAIGDVTPESVSYVARYVVKKVGGEKADDHYGICPETGAFRTPEYVTMSRRPGIGSSWFEKFSSDVFPSDSVILGEREVRPPRYYTEKFKKTDFLGAFDLKKKRIDKMFMFDKDYSRDRLAVRERVAEKNLKLFKPRRFENG